MQSDNTTRASLAGSPASQGTTGPHDGPPCGESWALRRAARRLEIDRDQRLVSRGLVREMSRLLMDERGAHPDVLFERIEVALAASRADHQRLGHARINLRADHGARFEDSAVLPAALTVYGHRGNYHGVHASMATLGLILGHLVGHPDGDVEHRTATSLAEVLHRRCEIWTVERDGVVHVFARPGSDADRVLSGGARRVTRTLERPPQSLLVVLS